MVKVSVSSVGTQASTVATSMFSRVSALNDAITKLSSFAETATLQGTAYSNAKSYATGTLTPMLQGMILFSETLSEKCTELQTLYASICGDEDLDSVVLESKLASDRASLKIAEALLERLNDDLEPSKSAVCSTKSNIKKLKKRIKSNQKKLDNLNEFNAKSAKVFADISNAQSTVNQALAAVSTGFSGYNSKTGTFGKPTSGQMEWTKTVKKNWKEREDVKSEELKRKKAEETKKANTVSSASPSGNIDTDISDLKVGAEGFVARKAYGDKKNGTTINALGGKTSVGVMNPFSTSKHKGKTKKTTALGAEANAEIAVAEAETHGTYGNDTNNIHGNLNGSAYSASASANAAVGQFTNEDGKSVKGIQAEAGVDAYIIEGEAKAGFKIFGLNIDASASAGVGLSARAKVGVTSEAAQAKLKLGPVGIGLSVGL